MKIAETLANKEVCEKIKKQTENELQTGDIFKIKKIMNNSKFKFMIAVVETTDKRTIEVPLFYFWYNNIRVDTNLESTFKVVGLEPKNNLNYPKMIIL